MCENKTTTTTVSDESNSPDDTKDETIKKRAEMRIQQKNMKNELKKILPTLGLNISLKEYGSDI